MTTKDQRASEPEQVIDEAVALARLASDLLIEDRDKAIERLRACVATGEASWLPESERRN